MDGTWVHNKDLHQLFGAWGVPQKGRGRKRPHDEVSRDLLAKVVEETRRLKRMQDVSELSSADAPAVSAGIRFSAIRASLQHASTDC